MEYDFDYIPVVGNNTLGINMFNKGEKGGAGFCTRIHCLLPPATPSNKKERLQCSKISRHFRQGIR